MKKIIKRIILLLFILSITAIISIFIANSLVNSNADGKLYCSTSKIPHNKVGLLLGTGKYNANGYINQYYKYRIEATAKLFKARKIDFILISGDNSTKRYDEPTSFKNDLIKKGVPASKIFLDYAGFRTLDSVVRSKKVFGQESITIISQSFHNARAIYIAEYNNIEAIAEFTGFSSVGVDPAIMGIGPSAAVSKILKKTETKLDDIDIFELNEAFASQSIAVLKETGIDPEKVNVNGGAIALGHPLGTSGARILVTLLGAMKKRNLKTGLASLCVGGGLGMASIVKRI